MRKVHPRMSPQSGTHFPKPAPSGNWGPRAKSRTQFGSRRESDVYERGARGDSLGVHRSGLSAPAACRSLPLFPNKDNLYAWLKLEEAGELTAREMPDRTRTAPRSCSPETPRPTSAATLKLMAAVGGPWSISGIGPRMASELVISIDIADFASRDRRGKRLARELP